MRYSAELQSQVPDIIPINLRVRGRARLQVKQMYRNPACAISLERNLLQKPGIIRVSANPLTGNVLIIFKMRKHRLRDIQREIAAILKSKRAKSGKAKRSNWHLLDIGETERVLSTSKVSGLEDEAFVKALRKYGLNRIQNPPPRSQIKVFLDQFRNLPTALLLGSAIISFISGSYADSLVILTVITINSYISFKMVNLSQRIVNTLVTEKQSKIKVTRSGREAVIDTEQLVPGDLITLTPGTLIPADARIVNLALLSVDESILTGESLPVYKKALSMTRRDAAIADRLNMVFKGCAVTSGSGLAIVVATGERSEIGKIQKLMEESIDVETPMQRQLKALGEQAATISLMSSTLLLIIGLMRRTSVLSNLKTAISMAVASIPESLPTVATTTLARGIKNLRSHEIIVRSLDSLETLAGVNCVCFDKTGTLTLNQMEVVKIVTVKSKCSEVDPRIINEDEDLRNLLISSILCNEASYSNAEIKGSSTESALMRVALKGGIRIEEVRKKNPLVSIQYRTEVQNFMTTTHLSEKERNIVAIKGSPMEVLQICKFFNRDGKVYPLDSKMRKRIKFENNQMAAEGLRVLGVARGKEPDCLVWLGLVGMSDRIRSRASDVIGKLEAAGIDVCMITGDQSLTASAIAKKIGIRRVYSRVSPSQKLKIIKSLQKSGKIVAMVGDGVNDGPALKAANVGIAMAVKGSPIAAHSADVVLLNESLECLMKAIKEGRTIHEETRKAVRYILSQNLSEILFTVLSMVLIRGEPFSPTQFLWINLVTDILPELALAYEPAESDVMKKLPAAFIEKYIGRKDYGIATYEAMMLASAPLLAYAIGQRAFQSEPRAKALAFLTLTASSLLYADHARSERLTLFDREQRPLNPYIPLAIGSGFLAEFGGLSIPLLRRLLDLETVTKADILASTISSLVPWFLLEGSKFLGRRL